MLLKVEVMNKKILVNLTLVAILAVTGVAMLINAPRPQTATAQTSESYTSKWTVEKWMNANMRFGGNCGNCYRGTDRVERERQGDRWTEGWYNRPFTLGPATWKVVMTLDGGATNVCEKWRLTRFRSSNDTNDTNVYGQPYSFPNDDTERLVVSERNDGNAVLVYGDESDRGTNNYIPDRWRLERTSAFQRRHWSESGGRDFIGSNGAYGLTILESAAWHASNGVDTDVDEVLTIYPTEWTVSGTFGSSNC